MPGRIILDLPNPALDSNGALLSGATLTFYRNGTTTLEDIYSTPEMDTPLSNPLVANSAGRFVDVWAPLEQVYTAVWKTSGGATLRTFDDITPLGEGDFWGGLAGGSDNTITIDAGDFAAVDGQTIKFIATNTNDGPATLNGREIVKDTSGGPTALTGGEIVNGNMISLTYDLAGDWFHLDSFPGPETLGTISPTAIAAQADNYHPTDLNSANILRLTATGAQTMTGLDSQEIEGTEKVLRNIGTTVITLAAASASSDPENRFLFPRDYALQPDEAITLSYDDTSKRWRMTNPLPASVAMTGLHRGLSIKNNSGTPNTRIDFIADQVGVADSSGNVVYKAINVTIDAATVGGNGLDAGSLANSTWYAVWAIYNPTTGAIAGLLSTSATAPTMPSGYTHKARFGWVRTDGSAHFLVTKQYGKKTQYAVAQKITGGASGDPTVPTWIASAVAAFVPTTAYLISVALTNSGAANGAAAAPNNTYGVVTSTTIPPPLGTSGGTPGAVQGEWVLESTNVYYASVNAGAGLYCLGWEDNI